jgi:aryl-alcohol dehydrogenase-like predicted oxidoreductase
MVWDEKKGEYFFPSKDNSGNNVDIYKYSGKERIISDCEKSLKRLGTDYIDLYQAHWPDTTTPVSETMEAVQILYKQGKIRAAGVSNYSPELMAEAQKSFPIASNQVAYSMVNRDIESEIVPYCIKHSIGILAYSPLQRGLLAGKIKNGHEFGKGDSRPGTIYYKEPNLTRILDYVEKLRKIADDHKVTLSQLVLNWTILQPGMACVLSGARNDTQVLENIGAAAFRLSDDTISRIKDLLSKLKIETKL